ncbi:hypothetical protein KKH23_05845 [Patescibacteria group bacterium]|nr:hypothetical protein [Patescibacteria group bacterium]
MPDCYQIPDDPDTGHMDAAYLRSCLGLRSKLGEEPPELPVAVRQAHYDMARSLSILGARGNAMNPTQLATVVALALREGVLPKDEEPAYVFPADEAERGQKVVIHWRKKDRPAHFLGVNGDRIVVLHIGSEVNMRPDLVRFPEGGEFPDVADNINQTSEV